MTTILIDDILDAIFCDLQISSLSTLARVSSHIRSLALPHLLHSVAFDEDLSRALGFLKLIISRNDLELGQHVRRLEIGAQAFTKNRRWHITDSMTFTEVLNCTEYTDTIPVATWAPMLSGALRFMPNLRGFTLGDHMEDLIRHSPEFTSTLLSIRPLRVLRLGTIGGGAGSSLGEACLALPHTLQLEAVSLSGMIDRVSNTRTRIAPQDGLGTFLSRIALHVASLSLTDFDFTEFASLDCDHPLTFPSLDELAVIQCNISFSWLAPAAPNISTLSIYLLTSLCFPHPFPKVAFPRLVDLTARYDDALALARSNAMVPENLRSLRFTIHWETFLNTDTPHFVVPNTASHLRTLEFSQSPVQTLPWWRALAEVLPPLLCLDIALGATAAGEACLSWTQVPDGLAAVPLEYVSLTLECWARFLDYPKHFGMNEESVEERIALSWANKIPTLRYIDVRCQPDCDSRGNPAHWFIVQRDNGSVDVRRLSMEAGKKTKAIYKCAYARND
ncbi:hypothetical protein BKA70DRAFT_554187 [Coprinopsis sp. MPI-PUGE-AT-0042]|nr:hypothetical protein BKA70DRAFT_554187 [Coprinopsis sp. MPI-PUGE-AT-0042]